MKNSVLIITMLILVSCGKAGVNDTVLIGTQAWAARNLDVTSFKNGDAIPEARSREDWAKSANTGTPAWCYYGNNAENNKKYGKLYNWYAVNDPRGLAPEGWHVANNEEWAEMITLLGGDTLACNKIKSKEGWEDNANGSNSSGFTAVPGGYRNYNGAFGYFITNSYWWTSTETEEGALYRNVYYFNEIVNNQPDNKGVGFSVRCIKD